MTLFFIRDVLTGADGFNNRQIWEEEGLDIQLGR